MSKQRIAILGSTGSIGTSTLDVIARHPERYDVMALTAATQVDLMLAQCRQYAPRVAVMASEPHARLLAASLLVDAVVHEWINTAVAHAEWRAAATFLV